MLYYYLIVFINAHPHRTWFNSTIFISRLKATCRELTVSYHMFSIFASITVFALEALDTIMIIFYSDALTFPSINELNMIYLVYFFVISLCITYSEASRGSTKLA